jgi:hypothetical protein
MSGGLGVNRSERVAVASSRGIIGGAEAVKALEAFFGT